MVATAVAHSEKLRRGLRPLEPTRDLAAVADLMETAFAPVLDDRGRAVLREMRWMARLSPLMWGWALSDPTFRDTFGGFVWEEPSPTGKGLRIVGNVSLNQAPGNRQIWIICNVVVHHEYRGRGIARQLTEAAIAEAEALGAQGLVLQVHEHNPAALNLYRSLGFREAARETDLRLPTVGAVATVDAPGYCLRAWRASDGQGTYDLARLATPPVLNWLTPVPAASHRMGWWTRIGQGLAGLATGQRPYRLAALKDERMVALLTVTASFRGGDHRLQWLAHPDHGGRVEAALISRALDILGAMPPRTVWATVQSDTAALAVLHEYGFKVQRTLLTMRQDLR